METEGPAVTISIINSNLEKLEEPYEIFITAADEGNIRMIQHEEESRLSKSSEGAYNEFFGVVEEQAEITYVIMGLTPMFSKIQSSKIQRYYIVIVR